MPRYLANCSMPFTEHPLLERPAAARAAGFDALYGNRVDDATPASRTSRPADRSRRTKQPS